MRSMFKPTSIAVVRRVLPAAKSAPLVRLLEVRPAYLSAQDG